MYKCFDWSVFQCKPEISGFVSVEFEMDFQRLIGQVYLHKSS